MYREMTYKEFVEAKGNKCPFCGSKNIAYQDAPRQQEPGVVLHSMECYDCGDEWDKVYEAGFLAGYQVL